MATHLVISDGQQKPGCPIKHWLALGKLIVAVKPDVVINIGDFWDMESLSTYAEELEREGKRYKEDIEAGNEAMEALLEPIKKQKKKRPRLVFTPGNHEQRIDRVINKFPKLKGFIGMQDLNLGSWEVADYLERVEIDGVSYAHYFYNPMSGRPFGGNIQNKLNKLKYSFTQGHIQKLEWGREDLTNGKVLMGLVTGAYYMHDEGYKGPQGNHHWRGVVIKRDVADGCYDMETVSLDRVMKEFGE